MNEFLHFFKNFEVTKVMLYIQSITVQYMFMYFRTIFICSDHREATLLNATLVPIIVKLIYLILKLKCSHSHESNLY